MKQNRLLSRMIVTGAALGLTATVGVVSTHLMLGRPSVARAADAAVSALKLEKSDRIAILGNTLPDRMQHDGWLESLIYARFPDYQLAMRNLSAAADEVATWHRSENFGTREEWLTKAQASVIFAFYGFNESFKGDDGLPKFKTDLEKFIKETKAAKYNGKSAPKLVLFSPIAAERSQDPNLPDPTPINANLKKYTAAMADVAKANGVQFVNLFDPSLRLFEEAASQKKSLTMDGIHLTQEGDQKLAPEIFRELFAESAPDKDLEKLRQAIVDRNEQWHDRYRTVDGYNVYGGRSKMAYNDSPGGPKVTNYKVMQEEMSVRDVMTANAEQTVWSVASGGVLPVKPEPLPAVQKIGTNMKPEEIHPYLDGTEAIKKMTVAKGCKVNLFADEKMYPELVNPLQMMWDTKGRLWVSSWKNYPERTPDSVDGDKIIILEPGPDGKAANKIIFMDGLNCPTGFCFYKNGILIMQAPDLWYVPFGPDGKADKAHMERVVMGMDSADSHHTTNSMVLDPGGATYLSDGVFHRTQVETAQGPVRNTDGCVYRFEPRTGKFERYVSYGFANPHGRVFDYWGNDIITDATGNASYFAPAFSGHIDEGKHPGMEQFWKRPSRPCPGTGMVSSRHFPEDWQQNFLNCNVIGFQGIYRVKMNMEGSGLHGESLEDLISSSDPNFRPSQAVVGPDGALYVSDWSQVIIGHLQHHLRDPERGHDHGRIYRITYEGRPLLKQPKIDGEPVAALLELLKEPEDGVRTLAKIELGKHEAGEVAEAVKKWAMALDKNDPKYEHHMTEALWVLQWMNVVDQDLLTRNLRSPEPNVRAAATRVLCYWRDRVPAALDLLKVQAGDESPRVRLEAVRAASFFKEVKAVDAALLSLQKPSDYYLDYCFKETMKQLEPLWKKAVAEGKPIAVDNPAGLAFLTKSMDTASLLKMPHTQGVLQAILTKAGVTDTDRMAALVELAGMKKVTAASVLTDGILSLANDAAAAGALAKMLPAQPQDDLVKLRPQLATLAASNSSADVRQAAWASIATADGSFDKSWAEAGKSSQTLGDVLSSVPLVFDQDLRTAMAANISKYLEPQMPALAGSSAQAVKGRYVRIELPKRGPLSLAEVQIFSGGKNIAVKGKASQSSTANGGDASKAIDGKVDGTFASGTVTHTTETDKKNPWWQVDLGEEYPIESIIIWNRTDENGKYAKRLEGFTLEVLDGHHKPSFKKDNNAAPTENAKIQVSADDASTVRRAAIRAAISLPAPTQAATFKALVGLIQAGQQVTDAAKGIKALPRTAWTKDESGSAATALVGWAKTIAAGERTDEDYIQTVQLAGDLAGTLPAAEAGELRAELKQLRVAAFVVSTVREQMRYDTARLVVEAGKPFEVTFVNVDFMPHNIVFVNPGARPAIGAASATMKPDEFDGQGRAYVPNTRDVLAGTKLVEAGQKVKLSIKAPNKEGDYEYVCTFPGHWELMWGKLVVTKDVDAYLAAHPDTGAVGAGLAPGQKHEHGK